MKTSFSKSLVFAAGLCVFLLLTLQCKKNNDLIPYVYVNFYVTPNSTQYSALNIVGGYMYVTGGVRGVILYRRSVDEFVALERNCPYKPSQGCAVEVDISGLTVTDACCGSQFLLMDGSIVKGPASVQMKLYQTSYDGTNLHVFN